MSGVDCRGKMMSKITTWKVERLDESGDAVECNVRPMMERSIGGQEEDGSI